MTAINNMFNDNLLRSYYGALFSGSDQSYNTLLNDLGLAQQNNLQNLVNDSKNIQQPLQQEQKQQKIKLDEPKVEKVITEKKVDDNAIRPKEPPTIKEVKTEPIKEVKTEPIKEVKTETTETQSSVLDNLDLDNIDIQNFDIDKFQL